MALELDPRQRAMLAEMGVRVWLPEGARVDAQSAPAETPRPANRSANVQQAAPEVVADQNPPSPQLPAALDWLALAEAVRSCQACSLCAGRSQASIAPLTDALACDWMVVGDPPDEDEDHKGFPFAGQDGVLLTNMLRALGLQQANPPPLPAPSPAATDPAGRAYVSQVLKCRPAQGAVPGPQELGQCAGYLQREIALVQPRIILAMGRFAIQLLLGETPALATLPLGKLRGTVHRYQGVPVVVTYHPKVLMRNSADKAKAWADLCLAAETLGA